MEIVLMGGDVPLAPDVVTGEPDADTTEMASIIVKTLVREAVKNGMAVVAVPEIWVTEKKTRTRSVRTSLHEAEVDAKIERMREMMQEQIDAMSPQEFRAFRRLID